MDQRREPNLYGYLTLAEDHTILEVNETFLNLLGYDSQGLIGSNFESILTRPSRIYYQLHFPPSIKLNRKMNGMYLTIRSIRGDAVPFLLSAVCRQSSGQLVIDCTLTILKREVMLKGTIVRVACKSTKDKNTAKLGNMLRNPRGILVLKKKLLK
ncbi:hypothetical protein J31TS4_37070 [Paenibacillus sp. J31TS4]|uniref:PAS domain-containing protein n=1 Tax=Paenibacillus sp. J31TS4 TaxID=2807195 RepID=UPI001B032B51|nr:PAS domain-containing protein [Paenibacillus sp. J31TS4]GIP40427.1 hypothetical protein J31TS4_37070 [Paenibacillus sp. J31TS4]